MRAAERRAWRRVFQLLVQPPELLGVGLAVEQGEGLAQLREQVGVVAVGGARVSAASSAAPSTSGVRSAICLRRSTRHLDQTRIAKVSREKYRF